ncbi:hypothetical protein [Xanthomarina sp. F2636L]|uniref:DUF922 domain-containing protein n=1 Tax=Xanthomarina sp. F2636L TaxID=2996018 RepID=UPI00225DDB5F|nr:hypothetical protein [Xanthomarina sp. F2636L]MCX7549317.1 hypothetical protein [Xanthomarina sp. F2636L]
MSNIRWNDTLQLSWQNFKDQPDPNTDVVAITASGMTFQYSIKKSNNIIVGFTSNIETNFYPEKSWYKPERANAHILSHEQLHFDITELHARRFRQQISKLIVSKNLPKNLDMLHNQIQNDLKNMQDLYDTETDYSRQIEAQVKWQKQIALELSNLSNFKSSN